MSPIKILVVDDHPAGLRMLVNALRSHGFAVRGACDAFAALDLLGSVRPDLILTDYMMPNADGLELAGWVRQDPALASVPVVVMSAFGIGERELGTSGCHAFVAKPVPVATLARLIHQWIAQAGRSRDAALAA